MNDYKFDRFYYSKDDSNEHYLSEIEKLEDQDYEQSYKGKMYCPWCKTPQLTLVKNGNHSYLRTYPNQCHKTVNGQMCPYSFETASKTIMEEYVNELRDARRIKSALEAIMRRLLESHTSKSVTPNASGVKVKDPLLIDREQKDKTIKRRIIPHYSFSSWGKNIPQDQLLIVYGKVYIELKEVEYENAAKESCTQNYLYFMDIQTKKKLITSCVKPQNLSVCSGNYYVVILGKCHVKESKGRTYYNLWVNFPVEQSILLKELSPSGIA